MIEPGTIIQQIGIDEYGGEHVSDITDLWITMEKQIEQLAADKEKLRKELVQVKASRGYEETRIVRDDLTGIAAVVTTYYRMEAKTMRLEFDPTRHAYPTSATLPSETQVLE